MKKLLNKKGFTLMEMLIVVAIIVILVAIAIPTFTGQMEKTRETADKANLRSAKAAAVTEDLTTGLAAGTYYFEAENGTLVTTKPSPGYGQAGTNKDKVIKIVVAADKTITYSWE